MWDRSSATMVSGCLLCGSALEFSHLFNGFNLGAVLLPLTLGMQPESLSVDSRYLFSSEVKEGWKPTISLDTRESLDLQLLMMIASIFIITCTAYPKPGNHESGNSYIFSMGVFWATLAGLVAGLAELAKITEYYTGTGTPPVNDPS
jgi:K(+)-stimulated pyrophosphate-energized sodium pump